MYYSHEKGKFTTFFLEHSGTKLLHIFKYFFEINMLYKPELSFFLVHINDDTAFG